MTPEEKAQFEELQQKVARLERAEDLDFIGAIEDRQIVSKSLFDSTGITGVVNGSNAALRDTSVGVGGGTVTHLEAPDVYILYQYKGKVYRLWGSELT